MIRLEEPWYLLGVLVAMAVFAYRQYYRKKAREKFVKYADIALLPGYSKADDKKYKIRNILLSIALMLLSVALANPQWSTTKSTLSNSKADIFIVLDVSRSMTAEDIAPSRLDKAKQFLYRMLGEMKSNNTGLILFAGRAYLQLPLTEDAAAVVSFLNGADPDMIPTQGTVIGASIDLATRMFSKDSNNEKMILVLSDGEDHDADAEAKAADARKSGITVNTIGIGTTQGGTMPVYNAGIKDVKQDEDGNPIITRLNKKALRNIAQAGGGKYFDVTDGESAIQYLKTFAAGNAGKNLRKHQYTDFESFFGWFLAPALFILIVLFFAENVAIKQLNLKGRVSKKTAGVLVPLLFCAVSSAAQESMNAARNGDKLYKEGKYAEAERKYDSALRKHPGNNALLYNRSNAQYQQENYSDAGKSYENVIHSTNDNQLKAKAYFNKGNTNFKRENYAEAINDYKSTLKINPNDIDAKKNLSIALKKLKQQQQQNQEKDQKDNQEKQNDPKSGNDNKQDDKGGTSQAQSKKEAERILKIIDNEEKNVMKKLPKQNAQEYVNDKDW